MKAGAAWAGTASWTPPDVLDEYRLVRPLGRGAMGQVYLAEDTLLDRRVAVKFIAQRRPNADARRRFVVEARAIARLSHPNVVAVHRVGEVDGRPYLVTELVRGRSLAELPRPVPIAQAIAVGLGVARGLAAAHRNGVLHRDVKPANVMLADDGAVKLLDFGLAKIAGAEHSAEIPAIAPDAPDDSGERSVAGVAGTPLYMAPEALAGEAATRRSDVYAVGAVLYELCAGVAPRDTLARDVSAETWIAGEAAPLGQQASNIDARFAAVVDRCLARDPKLRFASADDLGDALAALAPEAAAAALPDGNPYRGLSAFGAEHRALFFGRAAEAHAVLDRLRTDGIVVVAGDSGVGKSSLCRAGVLPLVADGALGDARHTVVATLVPGRHPLATLAAALAPALNLDESALLDAAAGAPSALARAVRAALGAARGLVVLVDQLEELVTLTSADEAASFAEALSRLPAPGGGLRVLATVRGDFFTRLAALPGLGDEMARALYLLRHLSPDGVRAAITGPATRKGVTFTPPSLVDTLAAAAGTTGGLPLLQFALAELWEARGDGPAMTAAALEAIGGVEGALARHADEVLFGLGVEARAAARRVLLRLVTSDGMRARRASAELGADEPATRAALEALVRGRLLVGGESAGETGYEIAHEALWAQWATLRGWVEETHEQKLLVEEVERAAAMWDRRGRREDETWTGDALVQAVHRVEKGALELPPAARAFLDGGLARQRASQRQRRWLLGGGAGALMVIATASMVAAVAFSEKEKVAVQQQEQIRLAAADMGEFDLVLEPFDWSAKDLKTMPAAVPPGLDWTLYAPDLNDAHVPGRAYGENDLRRRERRVEGTTLRERVEARSGPAFLKVTGRGEECPASWVSMQRLPGYTDRVSRAVGEIRLPIPSCQATKVGLVEIPAGDFYLNVGTPNEDHGNRDEMASLSAFGVDRTEVTRGAFAVYASIEHLTGDTAATVPFLDMDRPGGERLPIVGVNAFTAMNYCRFMGKILPSVEQWQKAMRGGITVRGEPNAAPRRMKPWAGPSSRHPSNIDDGDDGFPNLAPVASFPEDTSPYGVVDLAGNVSEWSTETASTPELRGLRMILGASWDTAPAQSGWRNKRPDRYLDFAIGLRCVITR